MQDDSEYMTVAEAREVLGVSKAKMSQMIHDGILATVDSPFDKRYKLIRRADVELLAQKPRPQRKKEAA